MKTGSENPPLKA